MDTKQRIINCFAITALSLALGACSDSGSSPDIGASNFNQSPGTGGLTEGGAAENADSLISPSAPTLSTAALARSNAVEFIDFTVQTQDPFFVEVTEAAYMGLQSVTAEVTDATHARVTLNFLSTRDVGAGTFSDSVQVKFCSDPSCDDELQGSPLTINTTLDSSLITQSNGEPLLIKEENRTAIATDLHSATYVKNAGVFVAAVNSNPQELANPPQTLITIDPIKKEKGLIGYLSFPAISVVSDNTGLTPRVAVAHANGYVTVFDLNPSKPAATLNYILDTGLALGKIALNGSDLFAIPAESAGDGMRRIHLADNTFSDYVGADAPGGSAVSAHANGDTVYVATSGTTEVLKRFDVSDGAVNLVSDSSASGITSHCGDVWSSAKNDWLLSGCGDVFSITDSPATDLNHVGSLAQPATLLKLAQEVVGFADSESNVGEVATISEQVGGCLDGPMTCPRTLSFYNSSTLAHKTSRTFGSFLAANDEPIRLELPVAAAYSEDGKNLYVLTRLQEMDEALIDVDEAYLHVIER